MENIILYKGNPEHINQPNELTHTIIMQILSIDGSMKELAIRFCVTDQWSMVNNDLIEIAKDIIVQFIPIISNDENAVGILMEIRDIKLQSFIHRFTPYILKPEYLIKSKSISNHLMN